METRNSKLMLIVTRTVGSLVSTFKAVSGEGMYRDDLSIISTFNHEVARVQDKEHRLSLCRYENVVVDEKNYEMSCELYGAKFEYRIERV